MISAVTTSPHMGLVHKAAPGPLCTRLETCQNTQLYTWLYICVCTHVYTHVCTNTGAKASAQGGASSPSRQHIGHDAASAFAIGAPVHLGDVYRHVGVLSHGCKVGTSAEDLHRRKRSMRHLDGAKGWSSQMDCVDGTFRRNIWREHSEGTTTES